MEKNLMIASASALSASALTYIACRYLSKRREAKENVYETEKLIGEYLIFHFGKPDELLPYGFGPSESLDFPKRCALECIKHTEDNVPSIALDIGCAVGRSTFELAKRFNQVVGIDFSHGFIDACNKLKTYGKLPFTVQTEGSLVSEHVAEVDPDIDRSRLSFFQGDACNLPSDLGQFGCVLAANLICRLPNPYQFLDRLPSLVAPGGILVITSPYSWLEEFTPKPIRFDNESVNCGVVVLEVARGLDSWHRPEGLLPLGMRMEATRNVAFTLYLENLWLGGYKDDEGKPVTGFDKLKSYLGPNFELIEDKPMPFFIRETAHKNQWTVAHTTIWKRRKSS